MPKETRLPALLLAALVLLCAIKGVWMTAGLIVPTDPDTIRDIGFIQGLRDGNLFHDPGLADAWRWYPPLIHAIAAAVLTVIGGNTLDIWIHAGAWLNLLTPLAFYAMNRALFGAWPALLAVAVMVLLNGSLMASDETAGYTPWTLTPALVWPATFLAVPVIHRRTPRLRFADAILIGTILGLVFLAHTIPAILLSAITAAIALACAPSRRSILWLAAVALTELALTLPFLGPLLVDYRLHIANPVPGAWVHALLAPDARDRLLLLNLPGIAALATLIALRPRLPRPTVVLFAAWIATCLAFLLRHFACSGADLPHPACTVFVVAPHHFHVYLQAAWASLAGLALHQAHAARPRRAPLIAAPLIVVAGAIAFIANAADHTQRAGARARPDDVLDLPAYLWILAHTRPGDEFVTPRPAAPDEMGPEAATVIAAGRPLVAPPAIHANPYIPWPPLERRRSVLLAAATGPGASGDITPGDAPLTAGTPWYFLPRPFPPASPTIEIALQTPRHILFRRRCRL